MYLETSLPLTSGHNTDENKSYIHKSPKLKPHVVLSVFLVPYWLCFLIPFY